MKLFFIAAVVAIYCVQALHGSPVANGGAQQQFNFPDGWNFGDGKSGSYSFSSSSGGSSGASQGGKVTYSSPVIKTYEFSSSGSSGGASGGSHGGSSSGSSGGSPGGSSGGSHGGQTIKTYEWSSNSGSAGGANGGQFNFGAGGANGGQFNFGGQSSGSQVTGGSTNTDGYTITIDGSTVTTGGSTITTGGSTTIDGSTTITGDSTITTGDSTITTGDSTITTGDSTITTGDSTITTGDSDLSGGATITTGDSDFSGGATITVDGSTFTGGSTTIVESSTITIDGSTITTDGSTINTDGSTIITDGSTITTTIGGAKPCGCGGGSHGNYDFNIDDFDLSGIDLDDYNFQTTVIEQKYAQECERRVTRLNNDNDNLTKQLRTANSAISTLTEEKSWVLGQLESCRDEYNCLSDDFTVITTDIKIWKKKYQLAYEEIQRLKTVLIAANTDILSWKTKAENLYIEYNKSLQINIQNTNTINQYTTLLTNLRQEITNLRIQINTATSESGEWKKQYETEVKRSASLLINIQNLEITIAEWVSKNDKANADLGVCLSKTHDNDLEISDLKDEVNVLLNVKSSLTIEISNCNVRYETCVAEFDEDEKQDLLDLAALEETKLQLGECNARADELDIKYQSEKAHAILLGEEIIQVRGECQLKYNQYDIQISELNISFQGRLDECNAELDIERNTIVNINIDITNLRNELVDIKNQLTISLQVSQDWESKNLQCEGSLVLLNETIVVLRNTIDTTNSQLTECAENDLKLQENLNTCNADLALSEENLTAAENDVNDRDITIEGLLSDISDLTNDNNTCNNELGELRCSINQFLPSIVEAENNIKQKLLDVTALFDDNGNNILGFAGGHNLDCPSCDGSVPCITNQAA